MQQRQAAHRYSMFTTSHALDTADPSIDAVDESGHSQASPAAAAAERWALSFSPSHHRHRISSGSTPLKSLKKELYSSQ